jgi:hypothetical protein
LLVQTNGALNAACVQAIQDLAMRAANAAIVSAWRPHSTTWLLPTEQSLWKIKLAQRAKSFWYPYGTLRNVAILERRSRKVGLNLLQLCGAKYEKIADIEAGDGDLIFFLVKQGLSWNSLSLEVSRQSCRYQSNTIFTAF